MACFGSRESFVKYGGLMKASPTARKYDQECYVCYRPYRVSGMHSEKHLVEDPIQLPCGHIIGMDCIQEWITLSNTCPFCRTTLFDTAPSHEPTWQAHQGYSDSPYWMDAVEPIENWEQVWYDAMGLSPPSHSSLSGFYDHHRPAQPSEAYDDDCPFSSQRQHSRYEGQWCATCQQYYGDQCCCLPSYSHATMDQSMSCTDVNWQDMMHTDLSTHQPNISLHGAAKALDAFASVQHTTVACFSAKIQLDHDFDSGFADSDTCMGDLMKEHEQWMSDFLVEMGGGCNDEYMFGM